MLQGGGLYKGGEQYNDNEVEYFGYPTALESLDLNPNK